MRPKDLGAETEAKGRGCTSTHVPVRSRGRAQRRKRRSRREILFRSEALQGLRGRTAAVAGGTRAVADMEQVGLGEVTGAGWYEGCVSPADSTSLPSVRCWFRPTLPTPLMSQVPPPPQLGLAPPHAGSGGLWRLPSAAPPTRELAGRGTPIVLLSLALHFEGRGEGRNLGLGVDVGRGRGL